MQQIIQYKGHTIGSSRAFTPRQSQELIALLAQTGAKAPAPLGGRSSLVLGTLQGIGGVAVKTYCRGGLVQHVVRRHYLRIGAPRCHREFEMLAAVRSAGIAAPEPVAFVYRGRLLYRAWLVTRAIPGAVGLAELCRENPNRCAQAVATAARQISGLISEGIMHADLHPGNVLVDSADRVYLIDFDGARIHTGSRRRMRDRYLARWQRAIVKHGLPQVLAEYLKDGLEQITETR